jgi:site-specific DNA-cytosine methylase
MMAWIRRAKPSIVIIENVSQAPWDIKVKLFEKEGYAAIFKRLDTKRYYIPHTRQRGYLFAVRKARGVKADPDAWLKLVTSLERPASASLDAFMLSNDDPRVIRGRLRLTAESASSNGDGRADKAGRTDWTKVSYVLW